MKKEKLISVIIPVYKVETYLPRCVNSVVNQTYKNLEIILVDDGSPDNCPKMCDDFAKNDKRIKVIHKKNGGLMAAWIDGVKQSSGEYIYFCDSDDWMELNSVQIYVDKIEETNAELIINTFYESTDTKQKKRYGIGVKGEEYFSGDKLSELKNSVLNESMLLHFYRWNKIFKRELVLNNLQFCDTRIASLEDMNISLASFLDSNSILVMDNPSYNYYVRQNSMIREGFKPAFIPNYEYVLKALANLLKNKNFETTNYLKKQSVWLLVGLADRVVYAKCEKRKYFEQIYESYLWNNEYKDLPLDAVTLVQKISYNLFIKKRYFLFTIFRKVAGIIRRIKN